ncbi:MAG: SulP family inorganic anion transporter [Blastocatellia bacterium]|nr:MAG: SulP family inorganic anion transporter [Blastocatellia bacterium]
MSDSSLTAPLLQNWLPGLHLLRTYDTRNLRSDVVAGVSVAAVAIPIGIAYSQLAGATPVVGIYSCLLPPIAYAFFGSSRQLIVNPDAAACAIVAATTAPLAVADVTRYADLSITLTLFTGILCIFAGVLRLGFIANFLSRPILVGYLNGIAISIIVGQLGKLSGISTTSGGVFRTIGHLATHVHEIHWPTLFLGSLLLAGLLLIKRFLPHLPGPLIAAIVGICLVYFLQLPKANVQVIGRIPSGLPTPHIPSVALSDLGPVTLGAMTIVLVSFCSMMTTARGFATKNAYQIDSNRDLIALGVCDLASGFSRGFVVSGADSRTAVADSAGGKTQMTSIVASIAIAVVLLVFTPPLAYLPLTALAAILISSSIGLFDFAAMRRYYRLSQPEFRHALIAMLGVMTIGVLQGVVIAVVLAIVRLLLLASKPHDAVLGLLPNREGVANIASEPSAQQIPGLIIYRFDSSIVFFNADHFATRVRQVIAEAESTPSCLLLDAESIVFIDSTGADVMENLRDELQRNGIVFCIARAKGRFRGFLEQTGLAGAIGKEHLFKSVHEGIAAYSSEGKQT